MAMEARLQYRNRPGQTRRDPGPQPEPWVPCHLSRGRCWGLNPTAFFWDCPWVTGAIPAGGEFPSAWGTPKLTAAWCEGRKASFLPPGRANSGTVYTPELPCHRLRLHLIPNHTLTFLLSSPCTHGLILSTLYSANRRAAQTPPSDTFTSSLECNRRRFFPWSRTNISYHPRTLTHFLDKSRMQGLPSPFGLFLLPSY